MRVRVTIIRPSDEDAVIILVIGAKEDEEGKTKHYQGYPYVPYFNSNELGDVVVEDGWLWVPRIAGEQLEPSIKFPGLWETGHGFETAIRSFTGINDTKIAAAWAMARRAEDRLDALDKRVDSIDNAASNMGAMASEALENSKEALRRQNAKLDTTD